MDGLAYISNENMSKGVPCILNAQKLRSVSIGYYKYVEESARARFVLMASPVHETLEVATVRAPRRDDNRLLWCSGYHVSLTWTRSWVQFPAIVFHFSQICLLSRILCDDFEGACTG